MDLKITFRRFRSALSRPFYLLTTNSFTTPVISDYELSKRATHHEIEWFFATTFKSIGTSPYRGTGEPSELVVNSFLARFIRPPHQKNMFDHSHDIAGLRRKSDSHGFFRLFASVRCRCARNHAGATAPANTQASFASAVNFAAFSLTNSCMLSGPCPVSVSASSDIRS